MGPLQCIFNPKVKKPLNLGYQLGLSLFTFKLQLKDDIVYHYSQFYNIMCVNSFEELFQTKG